MVSRKKLLHNHATYSNQLRDINPIHTEEILHGRKIPHGNSQMQVVFLLSLEKVARLVSFSSASKVYKLTLL